MVGMLDTGAGYVGAGGGEVEFFIVQCGTVVFYIKFGDNEVNARPFEFAVGKAVGAEEFGSAHLKPDWIDGVVDDAGLVGFTVSWDDSYRVAVDCDVFREFHIFFSSRHLLFQHNQANPTYRKLNLVRLLNPSWNCNCFNEMVNEGRLAIRSRAVIL